MTRREWVTAALAPGFAQAQERRPNVVLIVTDDQGWWDLRRNGNPDIETPHMDRLAAEGVSFERFYVSPVCAPTRASLMTGRYYLRTGIYNTRFGGDTMRSDEVTVAELLKGRGYRTGLFGKWHLGHYRKYQPDQRGFDEFVGFTQGHIERYFYPDQLLRNGKPVKARGHVTDLFTDAAVSFVKANRERPFFLYLAYNVPHSPNYAENRWVEPYLKKGVPLNDAQIYGMVTHCDANIGRLMKTLDEAGLRDNTVVIFLTDNGGVSKHFKAGLRGSKASAFEGGVRAPCFLRWPGKVKPGTLDHEQRAAFDVFATVCEIAGAGTPKDRKIDGQSLFAARGHERLFHIWDRYEPAMTSNWSVSEKRFKLVGKLLFDLSVDGGEKQDVAAKYPEVAARLHGEFESWLKEMKTNARFAPAVVEVGRDDENPVELMPSWARLKGTNVTWASPGGTASAAELLPGNGETDRGRNMTFAGYDWDSIDTWSKPGDAVEWPVEVVRAGRYRVTASYGCARETEGGRFRMTVGAASLEGKVMATGGRNILDNFDWGTLVLAKGPAVVKVRVVEAHGELMALNRIWFERIG